MEEAQMIDTKARCTRINFQKGTFVIAAFTPVKQTGDLPKYFTMKGDFYVKQGEEYVVKGALDTKTKYENSYNAIRVAKDIDLSNASKEDVRKFLASAISPSKADLIVDSIEDPIDVLERRDIEALSTIKGIGLATAEKLLDKYVAQKDFSEVYIELGKYGLTTKAIQKICKYFGSPDKAIAVIKNNPYELTVVDGYGFTKADDIFLSDPENKPTDKRRVQAYIKHMFEELAGEGHTWLSPEDFIARIRKFIPDADLKYAITYVKESPKYEIVNFKEGELRITTKELLEVENEIAVRLCELMDADSSIKAENYEDSIKRTEKINGWQYDEYQRKAIDDMFNENVYILQGLGGTGKSSAIHAFLNAIESFGYSYGQCALSGKAANNLTLVTGKKGSTIHSMLEVDPYTGKFVHNESNKLPYNVIVLDELSMVDIRIFLSLLRAIKSGSKLIMLGDWGQLEAIGVGIMGGLVRSNVVPMTLLKKIHRQAKESAIITHSIAIRGGQTPEELKLKSNTLRRYGVKKDLEYVLVGNKEEEKILPITIRKFKEQLENYDIRDIQIACSTKSSGVVSTMALNQAAQAVYNPKSDNDDFIELGIKNKYEIRVGDKVINMKNNKMATSPDGLSRPIFNGNTGVVKQVGVTEENEQFVVVDFEGIGDVLVDGDEALRSIELGYAATIHKLQGSTIKCVIFALPFHFLLNKRELGYTGMTRASEYQVIVTSPRSFRKMIAETSVKKKHTNLADILAKIKTEGDN